MFFHRLLDALFRRNLTLTSRQSAFRLKNRKRQDHPATRFYSVEFARFVEELEDRTLLSTVNWFQKISDTAGSFTGTLDNSDSFGHAVASLGDLDGDGVPDLAVGAYGDDDGGDDRGAVWVLFLNADGTVKGHQKISDTEGGFTGALDNSDAFGISLTNLGDFDGDGVVDLAVGAPSDGDGGYTRGAVWVLFLNSNGTVKGHQKISDTQGGFTGALDNYDYFGSAVANLGDLNGDGVTDLAVGAYGDDDGGSTRGAVWVLFLNSNGTVKGHQKISDTQGSFAGALDNTDYFGWSVADLGDLNRDGVTDLAVGAWGDDDGGSTRGAVWVLFLNSNGTVKGHQKISDTQGGFTGTLGDDDRIGRSVANLGDLNGDTINDLAMGATGDDDGGSRRGAVWVLFLNSNGTVKGNLKISDTEGNFTGTLDDIDVFGASVASIGDVDGDGATDLAIGASLDDDGDYDRGAVWILGLNNPYDFGDAPAPYATTRAETGPSHLITLDLTLGANIDGAVDGVHSAKADADDVDLNFDDEDGVADPAINLTLTEGTAPSIRVNVNNTTGATATLYGWIDYNTDRLFDNSTERASVAVPPGAAGTVVLVFPTVPAGTAGETYARLRLSTDAAAANPTGEASDGEVEDYLVRIMEPSSGTVNWHQLIREDYGGFTGSLNYWYRFATSVTSIGDLDNDGVNDLAVGADGDDDGGSGPDADRGAVWILFMNADGTVRNHQKISDTKGGFTGALDDWDYFGCSVASLGDLNGDGITDLAVGADGDDDRGTDRGAVWILFLNSDGTVGSHQKISDIHGGFVEPLDDDDEFGCSVTSLGDLNGDGITDLAIGAKGDDDGGTDRGAVWVLLLDADGKVTWDQKISDIHGGFNGEIFNDDGFGSAVANLGDLNGDGITDLAVGMPGYDFGIQYDEADAVDTGAVYVLFLNSMGAVNDYQMISDHRGNFSDLSWETDPNGWPDYGPGDLDRLDQFGTSLASLGDLNGDGTVDLAVGAIGDDDEESLDERYDRGAVWLLFLNPDGTVKDRYSNESGVTRDKIKITDSEADFTGALDDGDRFGNAVTNLGDLDGDGIIDLAIGSKHDESDGNMVRGELWIVSLAPCDATDFGDAPAPYATTLAENGPRHHTDRNVMLGSSLVTEHDGIHSDEANADDINVGRDDEDGIPNPVVDLTLTEGTTPVIRVNVTAADNYCPNLYGWIDYNADGVFDNVTERASVNVWDGSGTKFLTFPTVPVGTAGTTYARFRLSTDPAAANPTGEASDGEVEDYVVTINAPGTGTVNWYQKISDIEGGFTGTLADSDQFGWSVTRLGDLDGDGVADLAVGAYGDSDGGPARGAVWVLFLNSDGTVRNHQKISDTQGGFTGTLNNGDFFGYSVTPLGDLDGDGVTDLAVGAYGDSDGGPARGAVWVLFLNSDGTVRAHQKISDTQGAFAGTLDDGDGFGNSVTNLGDLDGDGITDLAVGAVGDSDGGPASGAVWILLLDSNGAVKDHQKISDIEGGFAGTLNDANLFGSAVTNLGDLNGDGVTDLLVGAWGDDDGGPGRGAVWALFLNSDGTVKAHQKISDTDGNFTGTLDDGDGFGSSAANAGDLNGDGTSDIVVGAYSDDDGGTTRGAVWVLFLQSDGTVKSHQKISDTEGDFTGTLHDADLFGESVANLGDLDGDGVTEFAVGAYGDDDGGSKRGAVWVLGLDVLGFILPQDRVNNVAITDNDTPNDGISRISINGITQMFSHADGLIRIIGGNLSDNVTVNSPDALGPINIAILGDGGRDQLTVFGTSARETGTLHPTFTSWSGVNVDVAAAGVEIVYIHSGEGNDSFKLYGSNGDDQFVGLATNSRLHAIDGSFYFQVYDSPNVEAYANAGTDTAYLHDSAGDDTFVASPTTARLIGTGFYNVATGFDVVRGYALNGGTDTAHLHDSAGDDSFIASKTLVRLIGSGFSNWAQNFEKVIGYALNGGTDSGELYDSPGDDDYISSATVGRVIGPGFANWVHNFERVYVRSLNGGTDEAYLYDSAGADTYIASATVGRMTGTGFYNAALYFDRVNAYSVNGGADEAQLYDSPGDDTFIASATVARLINSSSSYWAYYFPEVYARAINGGNDVADLYDSAGVDTFTVSPFSGRMEGTGFYNWVSGFDEIRGYSINGGNDNANLHDSSGNDTFVASPTTARMEGTGFINRATGFRYLNGFALNGGTDTAYLHDSAGDDFFTSSPGVSRMYGVGFSNFARNFETVNAFALQGGNDLATYSEIQSGDSVTGSGDDFTLGRSGELDKANSFDTVRVEAGDGQTPTDGTGVTNYLFEKTGDWL